MRFLLPALACVLLAACKGERDPVDTLGPDEVPIPLPETSDEPAVSVARKGDFTSFSFAYPAEAANIPLLKQRFDERLERAHEELLLLASRAAPASRAEGFEAHTRYTLAGNGVRLLSLLARTETRQGRLQRHLVTTAFIWDRVLERPIDITQLFGSADDRDAALAADFCSAYAELKAKEGSAAECPDLDAVTIIPVDRDGDRRFERVRLVVDRFDAPVSEEELVRIDLSVTPDFIARIDKTYRSEFATD